MGASCSGKLAEWLKAPVWRTGIQQCIVGSNPALSAYSQMVGRVVDCYHSL